MEYGDCLIKGRYKLQMSKIAEFFGQNCADPKINVQKALSTQICPFTNRICTKMRKSSPDIKIGTCSVKYQGNVVIICPFRLLEHNQIFVDCLHLLTMHEPGNELYLIPEVKIPGGNVDYFLVSAKNKKIKDLSVRSYICPKCGCKNDRDINASVNILYEGIIKYYKEILSV